MIESTGIIDKTFQVCQPRPARVQFEGAFYHAYTRGNRRARIFLDPADYLEFEDTLLDACMRSHVNLYAWCLMPNHFHLLLETPRANIAVVMQRLLTSYARYFNRRYRLVGHVFQGRYGAKLCDKEEYLLELVRYIHLNPYRVKNKRWVIPEGGWPWSSHRYYAEGNEPETIKPFIHCVLRRFGDEIEEARKRYATFLADGLASGKWEDFYVAHAKRQKGNSTWTEEKPSKTNSDENSSIEKSLALEQIIQFFCTQFKVDEAALRSPSKEARLSRARKAIISVCKRKGLATTNSLAHTLGRSPSAISQLWYQIEKTIQGDEVEKWIGSLAKESCESKS